ncbi:MAG: hypothetical protein ABFD54_04600 [Armatimonadota bacterium]|nr:hypothetical protein [bacterium]
MREILRRIKKWIAALLGFGLIEDQNADIERALESLRARLVALRKSAAGVMANQYRLERELAAEQENQARIAELTEQLESARAASAEARRQMAQFQDDLHTAEGRARDAQFLRRIAEMQAQTRDLAYAAALEDDLKALELIEGQAINARAKADAIAELNQALGLGDAGDKPDQEV